MTAFLSIGDVITIDGVYDDGTHAPNAGPIDQTKPRQLWRVKAFEHGNPVLQPLNADGSVQVFNDAAGEFKIMRGGKL